MDIAALQANIVKQNEANYNKKARQFIRHAQDGNVQLMLGLTSKKTLSIQGGNVRSNYSKLVIHAFYNSRVIWNDGSKNILDGDYNPGLEFSGTSQGKVSFLFYISVFEENGRIVIANIRRTERPESKYVVPPRNLDSR